jgi:hypothetical protein
LDERILKKIDRLRQTSDEWLDQALAVKQFSLA